MTVKELAKAFGLKVNTLAENSGYSKQGLYDVIEKDNPINTTRFNDFLDHLQLFSNAAYQLDIARATEEKSVRDKLIEELRSAKLN